jgi:hypothetical protein
MKTYQIEVQRLISMTHSKGLIDVRLDALVLPSSARGEEVPSTVLSLSEKDARALMILLKQQFAALEQKNKGRSQR